MENEQEKTDVQEVTEGTMTGIRPTEEQETAPEPRPAVSPEVEKTQVEIEKYLGEMCGRGAKVSLYRRSPMWCSGFCDQYPLDDQIHLEDIRDTWGGRRFELRILDSKGVYVSSKHVTIADIPRHRGRPLDDTMTYARGGQEVIRNPAAETADKALEALEKANQRNQDLMMKFILQGQKQAAVPPPAAADPSAQLNSTLELFKTLREFAKDAATEGPAESGEMTPSNYLEIARMFKDELGERRKQVSKTPNTINLPKGHIQARPVAPAAEPTAEPTADPELDDGEITIADELAEAGPETAAEIMADAFDRWSPEQQQKAISYFTGKAAIGASETPLDANSSTVDNSSEVENGQEEESREKSDSQAAS